MVSSAEAEKLLQRITVIPGLMSGRPTIRGQRFRVLDVLEMMSNGMLPDQILEEHPILEADDITACLLYAVEVLNNNGAVVAVRAA